MKINAKIKYALQTLVDIAMYNTNNQGVLQKEISHRQQISNKYLDQIISGLKSAGLIMNIKGKKSGYQLTRNPERISIYEIYQAFEGHLNLGERRNTVNSPKPTTTRASAEYWSQLNESIIETMDKGTLQTIVENQKKYDAFSNENMYYI